MNIENQYLEQLKKEILTLDLLMGEGISDNIALKEKHFRLIAEVLQGHLDKTLQDSQKERVGTTVSVSTLERIFKYGYIVEQQPEARIQKTLDKLCWLLGYEGWFDFLKQKSESFNIQIEAEAVINVVKNAINAEFEAYKSLPNLNLQILSQYFCPEHSAYKRIELVLLRNRGRGWEICNLKNPSAYEIFEIQILRLTESEAYIKTREYWYLCWFDAQKREQMFNYDKTNNQEYILIKKDGTWKVKTNAYSP